MLLPEKLANDARAAAVLRTDGGWQHTPEAIVGMMRNASWHGSAEKVLAVVRQVCALRPAGASVFECVWVGQCV